MDTRRLLQTALFSVLLTAGGAPSGQVLELRTPSLTVTATATEDMLVGPQVRLQHTESLVRGQAFGQQVVLTIEDARLITGFVGESQVDLSLSRTGDTLEALGVFAGRTGRLRLSEAELSGALATCQFTLTRAQGRYVGWRSCGASGPRETLSLRIPPVLEQGQEHDLAGMLAVLLTSSAPGLPHTR